MKLYTKSAFAGIVAIALLGSTVYATDDIDWQLKWELATEKINELEGLLAAKNQDIRALNLLNTNLQNSLDQMTNNYNDTTDKPHTPQDKNAETDSLKTEIKGHKEKIADLTITIQKQKDKIDSLEKLLEQTSTGNVQTKPVDVQTKTVDVTPKPAPTKQTSANEGGVKTYYPNGQLSYHQYTDENGREAAQKWHENGQIAADYYLDEYGSQIGKWWHENGQLSLHYYQNIDSEGYLTDWFEKHWHENGQLSLHKYPDENGDAIWKGWYVDGQQNYHMYHIVEGEWFQVITKKWYENGQLSYHEIIEADGLYDTKPVDTKEWYENGQLRSHVYMDENGEVIKRWHENGLLAYHSYYKDNGVWIKTG